MQTATNPTPTDAPKSEHVDVQASYMATQVHRGQWRTVGSGLLRVRCDCGWSDPIPYDKDDASRYNSLRSHLAYAKSRAFKWKPVGK